VGLIGEEVVNLRAERLKLAAIVIDRPGNELDDVGADVVRGTVSTGTINSERRAVRGIGRQIATDQTDRRADLLASAGRFTRRRERVGAVGINMHRGATRRGYLNAGS